jgi:metal-dependent hydrolase (beta-lactamase superfamily II)
LQARSPAPPPWQPETAVAAESKITILYDAFGDDPAMKKDWGFSALVEVAGKRILFDTGKDRDIFAANVKAKNIDLTNLGFVVLSHRHSDLMAGLSHVLSVNPKVKIYAPISIDWRASRHHHSPRVISRHRLPAARCIRPGELRDDGGSKHLLSILPIV